MKQKSISDLPVRLSPTHYPWPVSHCSHRCSTQQPQQQYEHPFESLHESPQEGGDEHDAGGGGNEKVEEDDENAETDRVAKGLMDNTALEPSPPPMAGVGESEGGRAAIAEDVPKGADGEVGKDKMIDGDSPLGEMISPRPAEQGDADDQRTNEAVS